VHGEGFGADVAAGGSVLLQIDAIVFNRSRQLPVANSSSKHFSSISTAMNAAVDAAGEA
jgi:hypothetical protein